MRPHQAAFLLLTTASCLVGHLGWSQQAPIAPLAAVTPVVVPPVLYLGAKIDTKQSAASAPIAETPHQNRPVIPDPVYIINGQYIGSGGALNKINPQQIAKIDIFRQGQGPVQWWSLAAHGIVNITMKNEPKLKIKARSLVTIKRKLGLHGPVRFELNGAPIQDESLQLLTDAIAGLEISQAALGTAEQTVVNIRLVPSKPVVHPPGTIMIRGLAQQ